ncbi:hypothetical protein BDP55DRAFT_646783 [Colletotrichum godetiae]|uniref:Uncharacterized protein n=1 Tax=Colletotrichum godetiae TaxID=1209918 RepID=A0AAJ0AVY0_9PEZI|nr:uncharacterized protein BDP55DRAFT_646783 [Colletotrichum godetiae]KAK1691357.1 hypothetical protein BDP55DRAFT_646783 [Colletotrichum godetiae]
MDRRARICFMIFLVFSSLVYMPCSDAHLSVMAFPSPPHRYLEPRQLTPHVKATTSFCQGMWETQVKELAYGTWAGESEVQERRGGENLETATEAAPPVIYLSPSSNVPPAIPRVLDP